MDNAQKTTTNGKAAVQPAAKPLRAPPDISVVNRQQLQKSTKVSSPNDPEEKEADSTAAKVMRMAVPDSSVTYVRTARGGVFRQAAEEEPVKRKSLSPSLARFAHLSIVNRQQASEEEVKRQAAPEEEVKRQAAEEEPAVQRQAEEEQSVQRQAADEEKPVQRQASEEEPQVQRQSNGDQPEEQVQRKAGADEEGAVQRAPEEEDSVQRSAAEDEPQVQRAGEEEPTVQRQATPGQEETVQRKAAPEEDAVQRQPEEEQPVQRQAEPEQEQTVQRKAEGTPNVASSVGAEIRSSMAGGEELPLSVRRFMEPRFKADFSNVRIHTGDNAAKLNRQVNAKAFAVNNHVFFGKNQFQPESDEGKELIAHELTHTIQQGGAVQRKSEAAPVVSQRSPSRISRLGISDALDYFADRAHNIPGFRMFTIILGLNPINMERVDRSAANILRAAIEFIPGGNLITRALDNHGIVDRVANWVMQQINSLRMTGSVIRTAINRFLDSLSWSDIFDLSGVWQRARRIFTEPITRIMTLVRGLASGILDMIKDFILMPLARMASRTRGWDLLTALLGFNPITGDAVPRNAETLIGGFMRLIGQEEVWNNIKRANAIARAWAWFQGAVAGLMAFATNIPTQFMNIFRSLRINDLLDVPAAFLRVGRVFLNIAGRFISWAGGQVMQLLQIIFEVVAPGVMPYIRRAAGAFRSIIQNPVGFVGNLVRAGQMGLRRFATNFVGHLRTSLINWLTGAMSGAGVYIPQAFNLREILKFVLSVLGLTWQNIRQKLVRVVGEAPVRAMETGFELIRTLITEGPAAAWQQIVEGITNLRDMVIEQIISFVRSRIITAAITRLVSMLTPAGAFIQAIIATYNTIMFFIERMSTIMQVARSFIDGIVNIAQGRLGPAAARVERTMAGLLTLVISFLARIAGLGRVADAVTRVIDRVRRPIDRALDRVVAWIVRQARRLGRFVAQAGVPQDPNERLRLGMARAVAVVNRMPANGLGERVINVALAAIKTRYAFNVLVPYQQDNKWWIRGEINPVSAMATNQDTGQQEELSFSQGQHIKVRYSAGMWVATITTISRTRVHWRYRDTRKGSRNVMKPEFRQMITAGEVQAYNANAQSKRDQYMGGNPSKWGSFGQQVLDRHTKKRYVPANQQDLEHAKVKSLDQGGPWLGLSECDLSHEPVDAVTFWNGLTGADKTPRSPAVRTFMTTASNYMYEESSANRSRASRNNERYTDPNVV